MTPPHYQSRGRLLYWSGSEEWDAGTRNVFRHMVFIHVSLCTPRASKPPNRKAWHVCRVGASRRKSKTDPDVSPPGSYWKMIRPIPLICSTLY